MTVPGDFFSVMTWWKWAIVFILSGTLTNLFVQITQILVKRMERRFTLEDRKMAKEDKTQSLEERFETFQKEQRDENRELRMRVKGIEATLGRMDEDKTWEEYNEIRREALGYVRQGKIDAEYKIMLHERYQRYKDRTKNKDLDSILEAVDTLQVIYSDDSRIE